MPRAILNSSRYGDALIGVVDTIRGTIRKALGTRPYTVTIVTRQWSGGRIGVGRPTVTELEIEPAPMFVEQTSASMGPGGAEVTGAATLTEVSLRYTEAELVGNAGADTEVLYRVREAQSQEQADRYYVIKGTPRPRRGDRPSDRSDWYIELERVSPMTPDDGVDAP